MMKINQSYYQRIENKLLCKLAVGSYGRHYTLRHLDKWLNQIIMNKSILNEQISWYLDNRERFGCELDINRKCRALGIPAYLTGINAMSPFLQDNFTRIANELGYKKTRSKVIRHDIEELGIYMKMYQEIELVKDRLRDSFPKGNPFEPIMDLMNAGAVIIRFKYVKDGDGEPVEKIVSYHTFGDLYMLVVHVEGDDYFSMYKCWGEGDEKLLPLNEIGLNRVIRWGIDDFGKKGRFTY